MSLISVVVPLRDERGRMEHHLPALLEWCRRRGAELVLADDGSCDGGGEFARGMARRALVPTRLLRLPPRGKGAAVLAGLCAAQGHIRLFVDADVPVGPDDLDRVVGAVAGGADLAVGDRRVCGSRRAGQPLLRALVSRLASEVSRFLTGLADSQCGCKAWSERAVRCLEGRGRIDGFAFDLEQILLARRAGLVIRAVPVSWEHQAGSRVALLRDLPLFVRDLLRIVLRRGD